MSFPGKNIILYLGMPKCASTSLRKNFFSRIPEIIYVGDYGVQNEANEAAFKINYLQEPLFQKEKTNITSDIGKIISDEKPILLSAGGALRIGFLRGRAMVRPVIAQRYKELVPNAKILIIIRNQFDFCRSWYGYRLGTFTSLGSISSINFNRWINFQIQITPQQNNLFYDIDYNILYDIYKELFSDVKIVLFEEMVRDMRGYLKQEICPFLGIEPESAMQYYQDEKANERPSMGRMKAGRFLANMTRFSDKFGRIHRIIPSGLRNFCYEKIMNFSSQFGKIKPKYTEEQKLFMTEFFAPGNRELAKKTGLDLKKFGYPM